MLILKIYNLDDNEKCSAVCCLPEGKHYLGRGGILNIDDKRVSRNHAQLYIRSDGVTIKSVHLNPCFFKASKGKSIQIIRKDESLSLHDGDTFSLLADKYWYRVEIMIRNGEDFCLESNLSGTDSPLSPNTNKRHQSDISSVNCKRKKLTNDSDTLSTSQESSLKIISDSQELTSPSPRVVNGVPNVIHSENNSLESRFLHTVSETTPDISLEKNSTDIGQRDVKPIIEGAGNIESEHELEADGRQNLDFNIEENNVDGDIEKVVEVKEEQNEECCDDTKAELSASYGSINLAATVPMDDIAVNNVKEECGSQEIKTEITNNDTSSVKEEPKEEEKGDQCASTSADTSTARRERCWYGAQCYRKNPMHCTDFSHPGDQDYDSDPNDHRPECPYGVACYRKNPDHRKEFKHTSRPAPKQNTTGLTHPGNDFSDNSSSNDDSSSETNNSGRKKRKAAKNVSKYNETPEDDYDYEDPFINDGSSDDFQLSEDDEDDTSDWDDSQKTDVESEDTKRLAREAKKFAGKKKRNDRKKKN